MMEETMAGAPAALVCAIFREGGRALFLIKKNSNGKEELELPCTTIGPRVDRAGAAKAEFYRATGIDGHMVGATFTGQYNCGSKNREVWIPAIAYRIEAKSTKTTVSPEYEGAKWLRPEEAEKVGVSKKCAWLFSEKTRGA